MKKIKEQIVKNYITTFMGIAVMISAFVAFFLGKASMTEVGMILPVGVGLILSKDSWIGVVNDDHNTPAL